MKDEGTLRRSLKFVIAYLPENLFFGGFVLFLFVFPPSSLLLHPSSLIPVARAQDLFMRRTNSAGPWIGCINNYGVLFNQTDSLHGPNEGTGGFWNNPSGKLDSVVYAAGLWFGGLRHRAGALAPHAEYTYEPNGATWMFVPGSIIYDGLPIDESQPARDKYRVYRSTDLAGPAWPVRTVGGRACYIDDPSARASAGPPATTGNEDMFIVSKDSDPGASDAGRSGILDSIIDPFELEVRTQLSFWNRTYLKDAVLIHNEIIYSGSDTVFDPVIALVVDGDINDPGNDRTKGIRNEACDVVAFFTDTSRTDPLLGITILAGPYGTNRPMTGTTSLRYWDISEDPTSDSERYAFLIEPRHDTALSKVGDARVLIASLSHQALVPGDTIYFDYAMYAMPATGSALSREDSVGMLGYAQSLTSAYHSGQLRALVPTATRGPIGLSIFPNPASNLLHISLPQAETVRVEDVLGRDVIARIIGGTEIDLDLSGIMDGLYFVTTGSGQNARVQVVH